MKISVAELMNAYETLSRLATQKMPSRAAYWVARLRAKLETEYMVAEGKRAELVKEHGEQTSPTAWRVTPDQLGAFRKEFEAIAAEQIEVEAQPIIIDVFGSCELAPNDIALLGPFIAEAAA